MSKKRMGVMQRMKRMGRSIAGTLCVMICLAGCGAPSMPEATPVFHMQESPLPSLDEAKATPTPAVPMYTHLIKVGDQVPVSRALVAKMLALAYSDRPLIDALDREIKFSDLEESAWYDRFVNACVQNGLMSGGGGLFQPESPLTVSQAQMLLDNLSADNAIKIQITDENKDKPISYALWIDFYMQTLEASGGMAERFGVTLDTMVVLAEPEGNTQVPEGHVIMADGPMTCAGLNMAPYMDKEVQVLKKDKDVIAVIGIVNDAPVLPAVYIAGKTAENITIFTGGAERTYRFDTADMPEGNICDIQIDGDRALRVDVLADEVSGALKSMTKAGIELKETGVLPTAADLKVYSTADGAPKWKSAHALTIGTDIARFVLKDGVVTAAIIDKIPSPDRIRVVLNTTGYGSVIHDEVEITSEAGFSVLCGEETKAYGAGESLIVSPLLNSDLFGQNRIYILPADGGRLTVSSIKRNWPNGTAPSYRGTLEIAKRADGGYVLVNELSLEEYLFAVVPSEMPSGHGVEASKVQAITARSYAYNQLFANRYYEYGANVDDSVSCQVYNNIPENEVSIQAVTETTGKCLSYRGTVISANYFSTSAGMTANVGEVWADGATKQFPSDSVSYLQSVKQYTAGDHGDLSTEEAAAKFLKDWNVESYDSAFSWFRWNVSMTAAELGVSINRSIKARYDANPKLIKTLQADGTYASRAVAGIGTLQNIEPVTRGAGGNLTCIRITGSDATVMVYTEYNIRMILAPVQHAGGTDILLARKDGTTVANYALMPSAFFTMDLTRDEAGGLVSVLFHGGGNGHGVGMSQNGVKGMIDAGFKSEEILRHYYPGSTVMRIYE